jgi:hypothetical protein
MSSISPVCLRCLLLCHAAGGACVCGNSGRGAAIPGVCTCSLPCCYACHVGAAPRCGTFAGQLLYTAMPSALSVRVTAPALVFCSAIWDIENTQDSTCLHIVLMQLLGCTPIRPCDGCILASKSVRLHMDPKIVVGCCRGRLLHCHTFSTPIGKCDRVHSCICDSQVRM